MPHYASSLKPHVENLTKREDFNEILRIDGIALLCPGPPQPEKLSLATSSDLRDNKGMPPTIIALFLLTGSLNVVTIATVAYCGFNRIETRFTLVVTLLLVYALLTLAPLVFLPHRPLP